MGVSKEGGKASVVLHSGIAYCKVQGNLQCNFDSTDEFPEFNHSI